MFSGKWNFLGLIVALLVIGACLLFVVPASLSDNLLFASDQIDQKPIQVILYQSGKSRVYTSGDPEYTELLEACYKTLANEIGMSEMGWSDARFAQARGEGTAVELIYAQPVKLPGKRVDVADTYRLFFPLEVFGAQGEIVFRGGQGEDSYWGLPIHVDTLDRVRAVVEQIVNAES